MKKLITLIAFLCIASFGFAQSNFFTPTTYRGALSPDSTKDWTLGWTNFDPQNTTYPATTETINGGDITTNTTWTKDKVYLLNDGYVYVTNNATLTIEPGTVIRGTGKGTLIITRGAKLIAKGTLAEPIIFTSNNGIGLRGPGNWGGLVLTGRAIHNLPQGDTAAAEGGIAKPVTGAGEIDGRFGGNNDEDSSGVLEYVRVEFAGVPLTTASNSEINGITFYAVGRKTKVDHVMVAYSGDDSYEWFGGTVNAKHLIAYAGIDDDFDTDNGFRGMVQFAIGLRHPSNADQSGSNGFESDNDANGSKNTPITSAVFSNVTLVGPLFNGQNQTVNANFKRAAHIRRNSSLTVVNSILSGYPDAGLLIDSRLTNNNFQSGNAVFKNNIIAGIPAGYAAKLATNSDTLTITSSSNAKSWIINNANDTFNIANEINLTNPYNYTNPSFVPNSNSAALTSSNFTTGKTPFDAKPEVAFSFQPKVQNSRNIQFQNLSISKDLASTYYWDFGLAGANSTSENPSYTYAQNGSYLVTLTVKNAFDSSFISKEVVVYATEKPAADFSFTQSNTTGSRSFQFTNNTDTKGYNTTYKWFFGVADSNSTNENPSFEFPANGSYQVTLIASNSFESDTITKTVQVVATALPESIALNAAVIHPNPANDRFTVSIDLMQNFEIGIELMDINGKTIHTLHHRELSSGNHQLTFDCSTLQQGLYFVKINCNQMSKIQKMLIVK